MLERLLEVSLEFRSHGFSFEDLLPWRLYIFPAAVVERKITQPDPVGGFVGGLGLPGEATRVEVPAVAQAKDGGALPVDSYRDTDVSGIAASNGWGEGKTTAELQTPTDYSGIYANWNIDLDGDGTGDNPWYFGTSSDYPTPRVDDIPAALLDAECVNKPATMASRPVVENSPEDTVVDRPVTTIDPDGETRSYSISGTDADKFTIDAATGQIKVGANPDLDYEDDAKNSFAVTVTATDPKGMTTAIDVAIIVTGVNEAPYSEQKTVTLTTPENQPIGTVIPGFPLAKDPEDDVLDYYVHGQTDNDDFSNFEIDVSNGQPRLKIKKRLDYKNSGPDLAYNFEVRVQDPLSLIHI